MAGATHGWPQWPTLKSTVKNMATWSAALDSGGLVVSDEVDIEIKLSYPSQG